MGDERGVTREGLTSLLQVRDDVAFIRDLTHHLASRYQRPLSSVVVTFESARMYFAGSFDPAYSVAIHALASQAGQAATNKRNLGLLQKHLSHSLGISPDRGLVRYNVVSEECFGWGGSTVVGQIASDQMRARREKPKHSQTSDEGERRGVVRVSVFVHSQGSRLIIFGSRCLTDLDLIAARCASMRLSPPHYDPWPGCQKSQCLPVATLLRPRKSTPSPIRSR